MSFDRIEKLITANRVAELGELLMDLTPEERKQHAKDLVAFEKRHRAGERSWEHGETLALAGAGLLPNASTLTPWLVRHRFSWWRNRTETDPVDLLVEVLRHRELAWLPDLVTRVAARMPARIASRQDLLAVVLEFCGEDPPDSDEFLLHLLRFGGHARWRPGFDVLIPRLLEVTGAGSAFVDGRGWRALLLERADRQVLLDGVLSRLQQGGAAREMDGFLALHEELQVTVDETARHVRDYVAMLPGSRSTVATLAQSRLRLLDEAGRLDLGLLCEASRQVFGRGEKKLIRTQLTWLGVHAKAAPDEVVLAAAELFSHESDDLRGQAVKLVAKHLAKTTGDTRAELLVFAEQLPADLAGQLGVVTVPEETATLAPLAPSPWPEPIATLDELTREALALFAHTGRGHSDPVAVERVVEALVRFAWQDREALIEALRRVRGKNSWIFELDLFELHPDHVRRTVLTELMAVLSAASKPPAPLGPLSSEVASVRAWRKQLRRANNGPVAELLAERLREITRALAHGPLPALVSAPTERSGLLDPATLRERLAKAEAQGRQPRRRDLEQASRRLPPGTTAAEFAGLPGKAAAWLRRLLEDRTEPEVTVEELLQRRPRYWGSAEETVETCLLAVVRPGLEHPQRRLREYGEWGPMIEWWPSALPTRREVVAAHLVPHLRARTRSKGGDGPLLPMLAEAHGPAGPALHLALCYGLGAELTVNRAHAVDAALVLASRGQLDGAVLGDLLRRLLGRGDLAMNRVVPGLRDTARSGAARQVWDAVAAALPGLWSHNRVADLVELAVELAQLLRPGGEVGGLADVAARKGTSKAVVQAKRLVTALS
ncbi:hypothetical protein SAMN05216553_103210 [Lentzea fradiae]|uniref:Uncharacterized protein n=1 Tax=Lentzea fradiae TaxID=200378 RepID=A0A1G7NTQ2_9PSEU|nr:DUF6493 family protein [Lentzea fradiae]SDF77341.1 hypothetical protein SAMN05216553_103210 [Lentzea fradiae]